MPQKFRLKHERTFQFDGLNGADRNGSPSELFGPDSGARWPPGNCNPSCSDLAFLRHSFPGRSFPGVRPVALFGAGDGQAYLERGGLVLCPLRFSDWRDPARCPGFVELLPRILRPEILQDFASLRTHPCRVLGGVEPVGKPLCDLGMGLRRADALAHVRDVHPELRDDCLRWPRRARACGHMVPRSGRAVLPHSAVSDSISEPAASHPCLGGRNSGCPHTTNAHLLPLSPGSRRRLRVDALSRGQSDVGGARGGIAAPQRCVGRRHRKSETVERSVGDSRPWRPAFYRSRMDDRNVPHERSRLHLAGPFLSGVLGAQSHAARQPAEPFPAQPGSAGPGGNLLRHLSFPCWRERVLARCDSRRLTSNEFTRRRRCWITRFDVHAAYCENFLVFFRTADRQVGSFLPVRNCWDRTESRTDQIGVAAEILTRGNE